MIGLVVGDSGVQFDCRAATTDRKGEVHELVRVTTCLFDSDGDSILDGFGLEGYGALQRLSSLFFIGYYHFEGMQGSNEAEVDITIISYRLCI
jgi:hypothetical protein